MIGPGEIFTILFVTLGPLKTLGPFAQRTHGLEDAAVRRIALWGFVIATAAAVCGSLIGRAILAKWQVSIGALTIAAGIIFFVVALRQLLEQYEPAAHMAPSQPLPPSPFAAAARLLFPVVLTPYGIGVVIILLAASSETQRTETILLLLVCVMALNLVAMLFARRILVGFTMVVLQILGAVLGVLQVALAIQFMLKGLRLLGVIAG